MRDLRRSAAPLLLAAAIVCFYWKLVFTDQYTWLENQDGSYMILPWMQFQAAEWHAGTFPLWDQRLWGGQTLIGQVVPAVAYPLNWILYWLPLDHGFLRQSFVHWYWVLLHVQAGLFCYWLCRDLGRSRAASILGGFAFGVGGFMGVTGFPEVLCGAAWAPAIYLFQLRALRGKKPVVNAALSGFCLGAAWLSGHHQVPIFLTVAAAALWIVALWEQRMKALPAIATFGVLFVLTSGLQVLPAYEYGRLARRWIETDQPVAWNEKVPYYVHGRFSMPPSSLAGLILPGIREVTDPFEGLVVMSLAFAALVVCWRSAVVRLLALIASVGALIALGAYSVFQGAAYALLPLMEKARAPEAAFCLTSLALAVLAAYGLDEFPQLSGPWRSRIVRAVVVFAGVLLAVLLVSMSVRAEAPINTKLGLAPWIALALAAILAQWPRHAVTGLILLMIFELGGFVARELPNKHQEGNNVYYAKLSQHGDIAAFLKQQPGLFRISVDSKDVPYNFGDWYGLDTFEGHVGSLPENFLKQDWPTPRVHDLYGVRYYVAATPPRPEMKEVFRGASGLAVFEATSAKPRAWTTHAAPCPKADAVRFARYGANSMQLNVVMACPGTLVISDNYFPGWVATIDEARKAPIAEVETSLRGIAVEAGAHTIELTYRPLSVITGAAMTVCGAILAAVLWWRSRESETIPS